MTTPRVFLRRHSPVLFPSGLANLVSCNAWWCCSANSQLCFTGSLTIPLVQQQGSLPGAACPVSGRLLNPTALERLIKQ